MYYGSIDRYIDVLFWFAHKTFILVIIIEALRSVDQPQKPLSAPAIDLLLHLSRTVPLSERLFGSKGCFDHRCW